MSDLGLQKCWLLFSSFFVKCVDKKKTKLVCEVNEWVMGREVKRQTAVEDSSRRGYLYLFSRPFLWLIVAIFHMCCCWDSRGKKERNYFHNFHFQTILLQWLLITLRCIPSLRIFSGSPSLKAYEKWSVYNVARAPSNNQNALNSWLIHKMLTVKWSESLDEKNKVENWFNGLNSSRNISNHKKCECLWVWCVCMFILDFTPAQFN